MALLALVIAVAALAVGIYAMAVARFNHGVLQDYLGHQEVDTVTGLIHVKIDPARGEDHDH